MRLLFVKGDKGLVANRDGLFYFPDRNSSIASEGLYNCTVTIDKGNYAFVTGNPVDTKEPSVEYVSTMLCRELFETKMFSYERIDSFKVKKIGCSYIIFVTDAMYTQIKYMDQNNDVKPLMMYSDEKRHYNMRKLYDASQFRMQMIMTVLNHPHCNMQQKPLMQRCKRKWLVWLWSKKRPVCATN